jgi:hypothetical protein
MPIQKFVTSEKNNISIANFIGEKDRLFFDVATRTFRLSDGVTPGGLVINTGGGGGGSLTGINDYTTGPVMELTDVNVSVENSFTLETDQGLQPAKSTSFILYGETTNNALTELFRDAGSNRIALTNQTTYFYEAEVVGRGNVSNRHAAFQFKGAVDYNQAGNVLSINAQKEIIHAGDTYLYDAVLDADNTNKAIAIKVNGDNSETMRWSALVKLTEVTHT